MEEGGAWRRVLIELDKGWSMVESRAWSWWRVNHGGVKIMSRVEDGGGLSMEKGKSR